MASGATGELTHASCVALNHDGSWSAALLRGPSGAGKSALALGLVDAGWRLIADDQTRLSRCADGVVASAPRELAGLLEVRGLGVVRFDAVAEAKVHLVVDLVDPELVVRLPRHESCELLGTVVRRIAVGRGDPMAIAKLEFLMTGREILDPEGGVRSDGQGSTAREWGAQGAAAAHRDAEPRGFGQPPGEGRARSLVLVTGLSGAGRTLALNSLEDLGYEAMDNLPLELVDQVVTQARDRPLALGIDSRTRDFAVRPLLRLHDRLKAMAGLRITLLYLNCDDEVLRRRFSETRRRHPLAQDRPLADGIIAERRLISDLRARADLVIDTSGLLPADLRQMLTGHFALQGTQTLTVVIMSFSYKRGVPRAADLVFDVRFLHNPHYHEALRDRTGEDQEVAAFVESDPDFATFYRSLEAMLMPLLPRFESEGKSYLTIAFGCTGGRHRSVAVAARLAAGLGDLGRRVTLVHRDLADRSDHA